MGSGSADKDFFVSYTGTDSAWAEWIAWHLEQAGYSTVLQAWDFRAGGNFVLEMDRASRKAQRTIAVLSPAYLESLYTRPEWAAAFAQDPTGERGALVPVRVAPVELTGLLRPIIYIDLVGRDEVTARDALIQGIRFDRGRPTVAPTFPGSPRNDPSRGSAHTAPHPFPGTSTQASTKPSPGVAGAIKDLALGDVVFATKVYGYHAGKAGAAFQPRPDLGQSSYDLVQRARAEARRGEWLARIEGAAPETAPRVLVAPIAAGEQVLASTQSETYAFLRGQYGDAVAVEMEGRGFLQATYSSQPVSALIVRGISDLLADKAQSDAAGWQAIAARHASAAGFEVLARLEGPPQPLAD